jgi:L-rhamnose mutarotase
MRFVPKFTMTMPVLLAFALLLSGCAGQKRKIQRFGRLAMLEPEKVEEYRKLYAAVCPELIEELRKHNIRDYSIYLKDLEETKPCLFGYFEYTGNDLDVDMTKMKKNSAVQESRGVVVGTSTAGLLQQGKGLQWMNAEEVFHFAGKTDTHVDGSKVQRYGMVIGLKPEMVESYKMLHKYTWPEVLDAIEKGNIRNYSIYLHKHEDKFYLFSYFEYVGDNFDADMAMIDNDPVTKAWTEFTDKGCQLPIPTRAKGEWWANMEEIFHCD